MSHVSIYVERDGKGRLYLHSNYITPGYDNPTKLVLEKGEVRDIRDAWISILVPPDTELTPVQEKAAREAYQKVHLIIDSHLFDKEGRLPFAIEGIGELQVVDHGHTKALPALPIYPKGSPPPAWVVRAHGCCLYVRPPTRATGLMDRLGAAQFNRANVTFASLVVDSATEKAIAGSGLARVAHPLNLGHGDIHAQLEALVEKSSGRTLIVLGHVENGSFVVENANGAVVARVKIEELNRMAKAHHVSLIEAGCNTASEALHDPALVSVANKFRSTEAVALLDHAINGSGNYADFLDKLSSSQFLTVVDENALAPRGAIRVGVYSGKGDLKNHAVRVGQIALVLAGATLAGAQSAHTDETDEQEAKFSRGMPIIDALRRALKKPEPPTQHHGEANDGP
jgi:hypothetical protein